MFHRSLTILPLVSLLASSAFAQGLNTTAKADDWEEINFEFNSSVLTDGYPSLLKLADILKQKPGYKVRLEGNTDWVGSNPYNQKLGTARANTVRDFLIKYGAQPGQVEVVSAGEGNPKYGGDTRSRSRSTLQRWMNRRVITTLLNEQGQVVGSGGMNDMLKALLDKQQECCDAILKRLDKLDEIANLLRDLKGENDRLRKDVDDLKAAQGGLKQQVAELPKPLNRQETTDISRSAATDAIEAARMKRFSLLGLNAGVDDQAHLTFTGRARYFAPFKEKFAIQAQGEYMYWHDRQEGQFDIGLVSRPVTRFQAGLFSSFKRVDMRGMQQGGTLGQASVTLDYIFSRGRIGVFGAKGFMNEAVLNRAALTGSNNVFEEQYLRLIDQVGASTTFSLYGRSYVEANLGYLKSRGNADRPGGTVRLIQPVTDHIAFTLEGGVNETLLGRDNNGRVVAGVQFGNFIQPKEFLGMTSPIPVDIPRVRYELLTRRVRNGNGPPVADAGGDQTGVPAGTIQLDGSGSYDPDGDTIKYEWTQIAGPAVSISGTSLATASFSAAAGQNYSFRLKVTDSEGAASLARANVSTTTGGSGGTLQIVSFVANPTSISSGQTSTLTWRVNGASEVTISGIGTVDPLAGSSSVAPTSTTVYTLTAKNANGDQINQTATVTVDRSLPVVSSFTATPTNITSGECSTLAWSTAGATSATLTNVGNVAVNGNQSVCPTQTTSYTLTAINQFGQTVANQTVTVAVGSVPRIITFSVAPTTIDRGQSATLTWNVEGATSVQITPLGTVDASGTRTVSPTETTTYRLTATNATGESSATAVLTVNQPPVNNPTLASCTASPTSVFAGAQVQLNYAATNATVITISGVGTAPLTGPVTVTPAATTTYLITAAGAAGTTAATCSVTVTVNPAQAPTAVISGGPVIVTPYRQIYLDAGSSMDPQGLALTYTWQAAQPGVAFLDQGKPATRVILADDQRGGNYDIRVTVTNSAGQSTTSPWVTVQYR